jgi:hypothetical protein
MKRFVTISSMTVVAAILVLLALSALLPTALPVRVVQAAADHVRWDIQSFNAATTPPTSSPGGFAIASARNPSTLSIKLTGSGTFVGPASGGTSSGVTGGGTWETFSGTTLTGSGTYEVVELVSWTFSTFQTGTFIDNIDHGTRANGVAVFRIRYSDGNDGILGVGCDGPNAPPGTLEGVIASKSSVTYWDAQAPVGGVDANRTIFHIM